MAPVSTPGRKKRENQFFDVGVQGRKTGITLEDKGLRDEYGMEPLSGIFSSPEKSPPKRTGKGPDVTLTTSEEMDIQESSAPEPTETLSYRQVARTSRTTLPPPIARSPRKTNLGSSPRRQSSMAPRSPERNLTSSPIRASSHPAPSVARRLDFSMDEPRTNGSSSGSRGRGKGRADIYDIQASPVRGQKRSHDESMEDDVSMVNGVEDEPMDGTSHFEEAFDSMQIIQEDQTEDDVMQVDDSVDGSHEIEEPVAPVAAMAPPSKKRGRPKASESKEESNVTAEVSDAFERQRSDKKRTSDVGVVSKAAAKPKGRGTLRVAQQTAVDDDPDTSAVNQSLVEEPVVQKKRGRKPKAKEPEKVEDDESILQEASAHEEQETMTEMPPPMKKRGRPPKNKQLQVHQDDPQDSVEEKEPPAKRAKKGKAAAKEKAAPKERDPNTKASSSKSKAKELQVAHATPQSSNTLEVPGLTRGERQQSVPASNVAYRFATPFEDPSLRTTRSGRASVKPIAFWKGERLDYKFDGTINQVVRAEEVEKPKRVWSRSGNRKPGRRRAPGDLPEIEEEEEEEEEPQLEEWEMDPGMITGFVRTWDALNGRVEKDVREEDIAFSSNAIETRDVKGANFRYAKIFSLPFFGVGVVDIPEGGFKRSKNTTRMQMAFMMFSGKAEVTVAEEEFTINKGGAWQVPRGNNYSIKNAGDKACRIFFAQACEIVRDPDEE